jgi:hypothetical protein
MESQSTSGEHDFQKVGDSSDRPFRHVREQEVSDVRVTISGHPSMGSGCLFSQSSGLGSLRFPSLSASGETAKSFSVSTKVQNDSHSSLVAASVVVPDSDQTSDGAALETPSNEDSSETTTIKHIPSKPRNAKSSRLEAGKASLREQGFEEKIVERITAPQANSSIRVYDSRWRLWLEWCESKNIDYFKPSMANIASYLNDLFEKGLAVQTITGHRSMLASALKFHTSLDISGSRELANLVENFRHERPPKSTLIPKWDLDLVLWTLMDKPFEPIWDEKQVPLTFLTWKVTFLLLLAAGCRRGELHSIPLKGISYPKDWAYVTLRPDPAFISKTRIKTGHVLQPFKISSLKSVVGKEKDRKVCPVRALQTYIKRTESLRGDRKLLLISPDPRMTKEICVNTISSWISSLISYVYRQPGQSAVKLTGKSTHEIRAYAASLVHKGCWPVEDVLLSGQWSSNQVFVDHYLRDLSEQSDGLSKLGPIVAGGKVIN